MPTKIPEKKELAYTLKKIEENFSNFSAWHQRTKVLQSMWEQGQIDERETKNEGKFDKGLYNSLFKAYHVLEFELVKNALYMDPHDQSAWLYHRWLIGDGTKPFSYVIVCSHPFYVQVLIGQYLSVKSR